MDVHGWMDEVLRVKKVGSLVIIGDGHGWV
jgi:hypothetical protein